MSQMIKTLIVIICINIFLYLGVSYALTDGAAGNQPIKLQGDLFDLVMSDSNNLDSNLDSYFSGLEGGDNLTIGTDYGLKDEWSSVPTKGGAEFSSSGSGGIFGLLDALNIIYAFVATLVNLAILPISLLSIAKIPPLFVLMLGIPLSLIYIVLLIMFIRGASV